MAWQQWAYLMWSVFGLILVTIQIGKPRKPLSANTVAFSVFLQALLVALIVSI